MLRRFFLFAFLLLPCVTQAQTINLTDQTTFYFSPSGSNSNTGLSESSPWLELQYGYDFVQNNYDLRGQRVVFQLAQGTYSTGMQASGILRGQKSPCSLIVRGNILNPALTLIQPLAPNPSFVARFGAQFCLEGVKMDHSFTTQDMIQVGQYSAVHFGFVEFGYNFNPYNHVTAAFLASVTVYGHYKISGGGQTHLDVANQSTVYYNTNGTAGLINVDIVGSPSFYAGFFYIASNASVNSQAIGWNGLALAPKYVIEGNGVADIGCTDVSGFPGNQAGTLRTGGQLLNLPGQCVAPAPPDITFLATPSVVPPGGRPTLSWIANSVSNNPTCWVHRTAGNAGYETSAPDLTTTITYGFAARGQKLGDPVYVDTTYVVRCLSISGAQAASSPFTVRVAQ